jgi:phage/plasmid-like protein (TIGR03299 family)
MSAKIFGERFVSRQSAWHRLGTRTAEGATATEAVTQAGGDFLYREEPIYIKTIGAADQLQPDSWVWLGGEYQTIDRHKAIVREPVPDDDVHRVMAVVGKGYTPVQNMEIAKMLDPITEVFPVETFGVLGHGEQIFFSLKADTINVRGDEIERYFTVRDSKDGTSSLTIFTSDIRVVCMNTLAQALSKAGHSKIDIRHTRSVKERAEYQMQVVSGLKMQQEKAARLYEVMADTTISTRTAETIFANCYPVKPSEYVYLDPFKSADRVPLNASLREAAWSLYERFGETSQLGGTAWAAYNSVVELEDHREGKNGILSSVTGARAKTKEVAFQEALYSERLELRD